MRRFAILVAVAGSLVVPAHAHESSHVTLGVTDTTTTISLISGYFTSNGELTGGGALEGGVGATRYRCSGSGYFQITLSFSGSFSCTLLAAVTGVGTPPQVISGTFAGSTSAIPFLGIPYQWAYSGIQNPGAHAFACRGTAVVTSASSTSVTTRQVGTCNHDPYVELP